MKYSSKMLFAVLEKKNFVFPTFLLFCSLFSLCSIFINFICVFQFNKHEYFTWRKSFKLATISVQLKMSFKEASFASIDKQLNKYEYFFLLLSLEFETFFSYCFLEKKNTQGTRSFISKMLNSIIWENLTL